ncbi:hypothetical protein MVEN_01446800 [Mycena venus]|uniref:Uncharacterized protein n=1 Tax=Mycena venus TaxID=2733690 RepID=A0A8H7CQX8_9AGAR|nr:hypothetical protein MVEN_01446800 [Mycena venus]
MASPHPGFLLVSGVDAAAAKPDPFAHADDELAFAVVASLSFAVIMWEYAMILPDELRLYRRPVWDTIPPYGFLALRYGGILATLPVLFLSVARSSHCQVAASLSQAGLVLVVTASGLTFAFRTAVLWLDNWTFHGVLGGLVVTVTGCCIAVASQYRAVADPTRVFGSNCRVLPTVSWMPVGNAAFAVFLITALMLTLLKIPSHRPQHSLVAYLIYRSNLLYLAGTTLTAVTALFIQILAQPSSALVLCTGPIATVFIVAFGTRAFRNMMLAAALDAERRYGTPNTNDTDNDDSVESARLSDATSEMRFAQPRPRPRPPPTRPLPPVVVRSRSTKTPPLTPRSPTTGPTPPADGRLSASPHAPGYRRIRRDAARRQYHFPVAAELVQRRVGAQHVGVVELGDVDDAAAPWTTGGGGAGLFVYQSCVGFASSTRAVGRMLGIWMDRWTVSFHIVPC